MYKRQVREVVRALKSILSEQRKQVAEWVDALPAAQWALNTSFRERYRNTPLLDVWACAGYNVFSVDNSDGRRMERGRYGC